MNKLCQGVAGVFVAAIFIAAVPGSPTIASAQTVQAAGNWTAWSGCWRPEPPARPGVAGSPIVGGSSAVVCVVPLAVQLPSQPPSNAGAQIVTIEGGKVAMNDTIVTGASRTRTAQGCTGPESARWSADGRRLYLQSRFDCAGGTVRTSDGMFAISPEGKWVNVESVRAGASRSVNVLRYSPTAIPETLPRQLADELRAGQLASGAARSAASAPLGASDVIDASRNTDSTVVTAWILERRQGFNVDASRLMALADAGVSSDVTDAMVAVSYPKAFTVATPGLASSGDPAATLAEPDRATQRDIRVMMIPEYSPFGYGFTPFGYPYGYSPYGNSPYGYSPSGYSPYGYSPYGYSAYGYSPYGYPAYGGYGGLYGAPVIVLKGSAPAERGYVVKGRGYTQSQPGVQQVTAQPRSAQTAPQPPQPSPSQGNANTQPAPSGRTAHERP